MLSEDLVMADSDWEADRLSPERKPDKKEVSSKTQQAKPNIDME